MNFKEIMYPRVFKSFRNAMHSFLIRGYFDETFTKDSFLGGVEQAVAVVSNSISLGKFDELDGLVSREAVREIHQNYEQMDTLQKQFIKVNPKDIFFKAIYEIGMIFDDENEKRYVEITTILHGIHGLEGVVQDMGTAYKKEQYYVCNYRFIREFTKGVQDDWSINKLNHFLPYEVVENTPFFRR